MTVAELIKTLEQYDPNLTVEGFADSPGYLGGELEEEDITSDGNTILISC